MFSVAGGAALGDTQAIREREAIRYKWYDNERVIKKLIVRSVSAHHKRINMVEVLLERKTAFLGLKKSHRVPGNQPRSRIPH